MANDIQDTLKDLVISAIEGAGKKGNDSPVPSTNGSSSHGLRGLAAGVGAAALAPMAAKGISRLAREGGIHELQNLVKSPGEALSNAGEHLGSNLGDKVTDKVDEAGGPGGILADTVKKTLPFGGGGGGQKGGGLGVGKGRRMPVQQSIDIAAPLETVYNQWTQFEDWPSFMHRVVRVTQDEDDQVTFEVKIWTRTREFTANIETQRPNERIKWTVSSGMTHAGVVSFHELGPNLTRVLLAIDVQPGGMIEKMARGMRHVKRAARGDLHRFKAFIEMAEQETGAWRGVIEDGEVVEEHDPSYDEDREYSDPEDVIEDLDAQDEDDDSDEDEADSDDEQEEEEDQPRARRRRRQPSSNGHGAAESGSGSSSSRRSAAASRSGSSRTSGSRSSGSRSGSSGGSRAKSTSRSSAKPRTSASGSAKKSGSGSTKASGRGKSGSSSSRRGSSGASSSRSRSRSTSSSSGSRSSNGSK